MLANQERFRWFPKEETGFIGFNHSVKGRDPVDMKRMNRIIEVNKNSRYVIVEAGCSHGLLQSYLNQNYPDLRHSRPIPHPSRL